ncbi:MAG: hypothetical protein JST40_00125 [Armatimonadetes bacterium]|nr:hypothetical protein [Armatimonadota bacterium]
MKRTMLFRISFLLAVLATLQIVAPVSSTANAAVAPEITKKNDAESPG